MAAGPRAIVLHRPLAPYGAFGNSGRSNAKSAGKPAACDTFGWERCLERAKGFEPSTPTLARLCSTPELHPRSAARGAVCEAGSCASTGASSRGLLHDGSYRCGAISAMSDSAGALGVEPARGPARSKPRRKAPPCPRHRTISSPFGQLRHRRRAGRACAGLHGRGIAGARGDDPRRALQEPVPQGQEGPPLPRRRPRTRRHRPEAAARGDRRPGRLSFGSAELLCETLGVEPGSVTRLRASSTTGPAGRRRARRGLMAGEPRQFPSARQLRDDRASERDDLLAFLAGDRPRAADRRLATAPDDGQNGSARPILGRPVDGPPIHFESRSRRRTTPCWPKSPAARTRWSRTRPRRASARTSIAESREAAGAGRFLGAVVRALQAADARDREGRHGRRRQGAARQDEHRRAPADRGPARHPVDPGGDRLQQRPAGRRLHGRAARKPGQGLHRAPRRPRGAERGRGPDRGGAGCGRARRRGRREPSSTPPCWRASRRMLAAIAGLAQAASRPRRYRGREALPRHGAGGQGARPAHRRRARRDRARRAGRLARRRRPSSRPASRPTRAIIRPASTSRSRSTPAASARRRSITSSRSCGATAAGTRTGRASSCSSSSRPGARWTSDAGRPARAFVGAVLREAEERAAMGMNAVYKGADGLPRRHPGLPLARRAAAAARADAAQHLRAALSRHGRRGDRAATASIGMIQPDPRPGGSPSPGPAQVGCAGRITQLAETGDGRYIITLTGITRFRVVEELAATTPYRQARVSYDEFASTSRRAPARTRSTATACSRRCAPSPRPTISRSTGRASTRRRTRRWSMRFR